VLASDTAHHQLGQRDEWRANISEALSARAICVPSRNRDRRCGVAHRQCGDKEFPLRPETAIADDAQRCARKRELRVAFAPNWYKYTSARMIASSHHLHFAMLNDVSLLACMAPITPPA
jgi:hypothetical protein